MDRTVYSITPDKELTKWDKRFLALAEHVSTWSKDPSTKVGAVIVDDENRVVSLGFNGFARGVNDTEERYNDRDTKYKIVVHAERNALLFAQQPLKGCTIYTYPLPPCSACASMMIQAGIKHVVCPEPNEAAKARWADDISLAATILGEAGVSVLEVRYDD